MPFNDKRESRAKKLESWKIEYSRAIFLRYIGEGRSEKEICSKQYFAKDAYIANSKEMLNKVLKGGYVKRDRAITITSSVKGRTHIVNTVINLTDKGKQYIETHKDLIKFYENATPYVKAGEYMKLKEQYPEQGFEVIMIKLLLSKKQHYMNMADYTAARNVCIEIGDLYKEKDYQTQAIYYYVNALYLEVSGAEYFDKFADYIEKRISFHELNNKYRKLFIDPALISNIEVVKDGYRDDIVDHIYKKNKIKMNLYKQRDFKELLKDIMNCEPLYHRWQKFHYNAFVGMIAYADRYRKQRD